MKDTLYANYYNLDCAEIDELNSGKEFYHYCVKRAGRPVGYQITQNARIIEQMYILTTMNLYEVISELGLKNCLLFGQLAKQCADFIARLSKSNPNGSNYKNAAYAFRQMVFYLSFVLPDELDSVVSEIKVRFGFHSQLCEVFSQCISGEVNFIFQAWVKKRSETEWFFVK
ncbi:hypothetical protein GEMRC1_004430 [Eukaryota sp. GEM-RC1]